jgi:hypothetical protein
MKTKNILFLLLLNTLLFTKAAQAQTDSAKLMLSNFYKAYIPTFDMPGAAMSSKIQKQYSTAKLTAWLKKQFEEEELDYDPYVNAQDADQDWLKTIQINKDAKTPNLYIVSFFDNYEKKRFYVRLFVAKEGNKYKISGFKR